MEQQGVEALPDLAKNATFHELQVQLAMADGEHARMASQFKPNYPGVAELKRKADTIREHLAGRDRAGRRGRCGAPIAPRARRKSGCARASTSRRRRRSSRRTPRVEYAILAREVDTNRALYESVLQRMKEMTVAVEARARTCRSPIARSCPLRAVRRRAACAIDRRSRRCSRRSPGVVLSRPCATRSTTACRPPTTSSARRALPSLGVVPDMTDGAEGPAARPMLATSPRRARAADGPTIVVAGQPCPALTDAYRHVRTSLLLSKPGGPPRSLLVASGLEKEGKTLTAANLAVAFSHLGTVLLVDGDLRRPSCHRLLRRAGRPGAQRRADRTVSARRRAPPDRRQAALPCCPAGATPPNPTELLGSEEMRCLLTEAGMRFDYVIVDSPAAFGVADASSALDARRCAWSSSRAAGRRARRFLRKLRARLAYAHAPVVGVVLAGGDDTNEPTSRYYRTIEVAHAAQPADARGRARRLTRAVHASRSSSWRSRRRSWQAHSRRS